MRTSFQSASSSSATIWASAVPTPWPISAFVMCTVMIPSGVIVRAAFGSNAAADVAGHRGHDLLVGRVGALRQERRRLHDLARLAVAALRHLLGDPRLLEGMLPLGVEPFDRRDLLSGGLGEGRLARPHRRAVEVDGARAALRAP